MSSTEHSIVSTLIVFWGGGEISKGYFREKLLNSLSEG